MGWDLEGKRALYKCERGGLFQGSCSLEASLMKTNDPLLASRKVEIKSDNVDNRASINIKE